jgi:Heavy metal binding domain
MILAVAAFCLYTTPPPNPRVLAALDALSSRHSHQVRGDTDGSFYCPMEPDIRSNQAGKCPRCGMTLVEGVPDILEYPVDLSVDPPVPHPNELTRLTFGLIDPRTERPVRTLEVVHEKLYHVFVVSQDLSFFLHTHPERNGDEDFHLDVRLPKPGLYRVLSDFYPSGATPQLVTNTLIVPGAQTTMDGAHIQADVSPKTTENARVDLTLSPSHIVARQDVSMVFRVRPEQGVEPYLGAWGHMLAASADLVDMTHNHPIAAADSSGGAGKDIQFNMAFPRAGVYRVWVQFQRLGVVNTVAFNVPVEEALQ